MVLVLLHHFEEWNDSKVVMWCNQQAFYYFLKTCVYTFKSFSLYFIQITWIIRRTTWHFKTPGFVWYFNVSWLHRMILLVTPLDKIDFFFLRKKKSKRLCQTLLMFSFPVFCYFICSFFYTFFTLCSLKKISKLIFTQQLKFPYYFYFFQIWPFM